MISSLGGVSPTSEVELSALKYFAQYTSGQKKEAALEAMESLIESNKENHQVEYLGGIVLVLEDKLDQALELLSFHQGSLEV